MKKDNARIIIDDILKIMIINMYITHIILH